MSYLPVIARGVHDLTSKVGGYVASAARGTADAIEEGAKAYIPAFERAAKDAPGATVKGLGMLGGAAAAIPNMMKAKPEVINLGPDDPAPIRENQARDLMHGAIDGFPFSDAAKEKLKNAKIELYDTHVNEGLDGKHSASYYQVPGGDINDKLSFLPEGVRNLISSRLSFLDPGSLHFSDKADNDSAVHESLNYLFNEGELGGAKAGDMSANKDKRAEFGKAWDAIVAKGTDDPDGDTLYAIEDQMKGLNEDGNYDKNSDRFAFLGAQVLKNGIQVVPKELRPYFASILKEQGDAQDGAPEAQAPKPQQDLPADIIPPSEHLAPVIDKVATATSTPPEVLKTILMMESSMAYDDANINPKIGQYAWVAGLTNTAKKDLEKAGVPVDFNTREGALKAASDFWQLLQKRYPNESPEDLYFKHYYAGPQNGEDRRELFRKALASYGG